MAQLALYRLVVAVVVVDVLLFVLLVSPLRDENASSSAVEVAAVDWSSPFHLKKRDILAALLYGGSIASSVESSCCLPPLIA